MSEPIILANSSDSIGLAVNLANGEVKEFRNPVGYVYRHENGFQMFDYLIEGREVDYCASVRGATFMAELIIENDISVGSGGTSARVSGKSLRIWKMTADASTIIEENDGISWETNPSSVAYYLSGQWIGVSEIE